ncbi:MAG: hypothetical protein ABSF95_07630 [Verrucomicrobiota bacterium]|jgi:hypothetical protein
MPIERHLKARLEPLARRRRQLRLWWRVAACWAGAGLVGLGLVALQRASGWTSALACPVLALLSAGAVSWVLLRQRREEPDWRALARQVECQHPDLDGRLLTAIQQAPKGGGALGFMQERLAREVLAQSCRGDWAATVPQRRLRWARTAHWLALLLLVAALSGLRTSGGRRLLARNPDFGLGVTVSPGDTHLERGESLVVVARFRGRLPAHVDLVIGQTPDVTRRIPLVKSLSDPLFGGSVPEVASNLVYHVQYGARRTRDFKVTVFDYPRLERADAEVTFPDYAAQAPKHIENTRRLSAVEGSRLDLALRFNKPVAAARLVTKDKARNTLTLLLGTNRALATLKQFPLTASKSYDLQLVDADGRTNKTPAQFVIEVSKNRPPELRLAAPRGDLRPSPLEEIAFEGTVWDDFGVQAYGLGYTVAGQELQLLELGRAVPAQEKRPFHYLLRLEELGAQPDQLISWFVWAEDLGPDGQARRTTGDLFFAEVRPFDEVFREGPSLEGSGEGEAQGGEQSGDQAGRSGRLVEMEKQIMIATWKLQRQRGQPAARPIQSPKSETRNKSQRESQSGERGIPTRTLSLSMGQEPKMVAAPGSWEVTQLRAALGWASTPWVTGRVAEGAAVGEAVSNSKRPGGGRSFAQDQPPKPPALADDAGVVLEAQAQALEQAKTALGRQSDPRTAALWSRAIQEMQRALARLQAATNSPAALAEALAAEQAAYQALLQVQEHDYQVSRRGNRNQRGNAAERQMQRQLEQMDLTESDNRYEQPRQAPPPESGQRREQLQVLNRLQELAQRQQDLNDRLKELQTALQEARTEEERAEIGRRLKRLQEEEQQMVGDLDELRQRMDRPENQSNLAREGQELEQTRQDLQRAARAAGQGAASQALAAGRRAQEQLRQLRDQMRQANSSQFAQDLRQMRAQARELARQQADLQQQLLNEAGANHKSLSDSGQRRQMVEQLARQRERLTNLVDRATQVSEQAEGPEPLLSRQLYDTVRRFSQDSAKDVKELQEQLLQRRVMTRNLLDQLSSSEPDGAKLLDATSELLRLDFLPEAGAVAQRTGPRLEELKRGVERAAESVLGDDTEALRLAQQELNRLTEQLQQEMQMAQAEGGAARTNQPPSAGGQTAGQDRPNAGQPGSRENQGSPGVQSAERQAASARNGQPAGDGTQRAGTGPTGQPGAEARNEAGGERQTAANGRAGRGPADDAGRSSSSAGGWFNTASAGGLGGDAGGNWPRDLNRLLDERGWRREGPLTGDDFVSWSERLRDVEQMIEEADLRNEVAAAGERARVLRQAVKRERKKPDWAVVRLQVMQPLREVRDRIAEELARRHSREALVPIDRDPVPNRYSELVRRYYEELGKDK